MSAPKIDRIIEAYAGRTSDEAVDYAVLHVDSFPSDVALLANSREGLASLIIPLPWIEAATARHTKELSLLALPTLEYTREHVSWRGAAAVVECRDHALLKSFSALVAAFVSRLILVDRVTWDHVSALFSEWERLFGRRTALSPERELGLWAELWWLSRADNLTTLLDGWRGPEGAAVDFLLSGSGFEIKAGRRRGCHYVSQAQVDDAVGDAASYFVSMLVQPDPVRGRSLSELVHELGRRVESSGLFEEKLAAAGYVRADEHLYSRRLVLLERPSLYMAVDVPRVRTVDPGVSELRYRVQLPLDAALDGDALVNATAALSVDLTKETYPCA
jgi:hypothetical protein